MLSLIGFSLTTGLFLGAILWSFLCDRYGRVYTFKKTLVISMIGTVLIAVSVNLAMLCVAFFLLGFGCGGDLVITACIFLENCP
jgi:MFS family permease